MILSALFASAFAEEAPPPPPAPPAPLAAPAPPAPAPLPLAEPAPAAAPEPLPLPQATPARSSGSPEERLHRRIARYDKVQNIGLSVVAGGAFLHITGALALSSQQDCFDCDSTVLVLGVAGMGYGILAIYGGATTALVADGIERGHLNEPGPPIGYVLMAAGTGAGIVGLGGLASFGGLLDEDTSLNLLVTGPLVAGGGAVIQVLLDRAAQSKGIHAEVPASAPRFTATLVPTGNGLALVGAF